jgi:hypothetical protein
MEAIRRNDVEDFPAIIIDDRVMTSSRIESGVRAYIPNSGRPGERRVFAGTTIV